MTLIGFFYRCVVNGGNVFNAHTCEQISGRAIFVLKGFDVNTLLDRVTVNFLPMI